MTEQEHPAVSDVNAEAADRILFLSLLGVVLLAPLPLASVPDWAWSTGSFGIGALLVAWASLNAVGKANSHPVAIGRIFIPAVLFLGGLIWAVLQELPILPESWLHPLWHDVHDLFGEAYKGSISINPSRSTEIIIRLMTVAGVFWLSLQYCRDPARAKQAVTVSAIAGCIYAAYGLIELFSGSETILWLPKHAYLGDLTSTFVNRNNYATFAGLGWLCLLAIFFRNYSHGTRGIRDRSERLRETVRFMERKGWYLLVGILIMASALLLSHSRAGFASTLAGIFAFCISLSLGAKTDKVIARTFAATCLALALLFYAASGRGTDERLATTNLAAESRVEVYARTEEAISNQPLLGTGLGTFEEIFRFYRPASIIDTFDFAHNSYLELALELGIPGASLILASLASIVVIMARGTRIRQRDTVYPCLGVAATVLVAVHSTVDFSVQIPAVADFYALLLGIGVAQSFTSRDAS